MQSPQAYRPPFLRQSTPVIRKRVPERYLGSYNLCDDRAPEKAFACRTVHCRPFQQIRMVEPHHRKPKASDNPYGPDNLSEDYWSPRFSCGLFRPAKTANASTRIDITIPNISSIKFQGDAPIQSADCMHRLWASMPHIIFFSGKNQTEFPKKLNFAKPVLRWNFAALPFRQIYRKLWSLG